jgi:hypothetical protein
MTVEVFVDVSPRRVEGRQDNRFRRHILDQAILGRVEGHLVGKGICHQVFSCAISVCLHVIVGEVRVRLLLLLVREDADYRKD